MAGAAWALALLLYMGLLSWAAAREASFLNPKGLQAAALAGFLLLLWRTAVAFGPLYVIPIAAAAALVGIPFFMFLVGDWFERAVRKIRGLDAMTVAKTYDRAEKTERAGDLDGALALYREELARDPADGEARRRVGDLLLKKGDVSGAVASFRETLAGMASGEGKATLAFRVADLLENEGRAGESRDLLETVARELQGTRFEEYARQRLSRLGTVS